MLLCIIMVLDILFDGDIIQTHKSHLFAPTPSKCHLPAKGPRSKSYI